MTNKNHKYPVYYYLAILFFVLLSTLFWWIIVNSFYLRNSFNKVEPRVSVGKSYHENPESYNQLIGITYPVDEDFIKVDSTSHRRIITNLLNIALKDKERNILEFASDLKKQYPEEEYEITLIDSVINRLQIKLPENERTTFKTEVKIKMANDELLIWEESLFMVSDYPLNDPMLANPQYRWYLDSIHIENAWNTTFGDKSITIAILDNGFELSHPELKGKDGSNLKFTSKNSLS